MLDWVDCDLGAECFALWAGKEIYLLIEMTGNDCVNTQTAIVPCGSNTEVEDEPS